MKYNNREDYDVACKETLIQCKDMLKERSIASFKIIMEYPDVTVDVEYLKPVDWTLLDWTLIL